MSLHGLRPIALPTGTAQRTMLPVHGDVVPLEHGAPLRSRYATTLENSVAPLQALTLSDPLHIRQAEVRNGDELDALPVNP